MIAVGEGMESEHGLQAKDGGVQCLPLVCNDDGHVGFLSF